MRAGLIGRYGGSETHAWRVLKAVLPLDRYEVHIERTSLEEMAQSGHWYVGAANLKWPIGHAIAFCVEPGGDAVVVRDPMEGERRESWDEFQRKWWGVSVWAEVRK